MRCVNAILTGLRLSALFGKPRTQLGAMPESKGDSAQAVGLTTEAQSRSPVGEKLGATSNVPSAGPEPPPDRTGEQARGAGTSIVSIIGTITLVEPTQLTVGDKVVVVGPGTELNGVPAMGLRARAQGWLQPDRNIMATSVEVLLP